MKKIFESIKDLIYDSIDYLIMISIIGIVVFVIGWRINILFAEKPADEPVSNVDLAEENRDHESTAVNDDEDIEVPADDESTSPSPQEVDEPEVDDESTPSNIANEGEIVKVVIPAGSLPSKIGDILVQGGLVSNRSDFISKSQELNLDTKLKSGNYDIELGTSIENIIKIIAK